MALRAVVHRTLALCFVTADAERMEGRLDARDEAGRFGFVAGGAGHKSRLQSLPVFPTRGGKAVAVDAGFHGFRRGKFRGSAFGSAWKGLAVATCAARVYGVFQGENGTHGLAPVVAVGAVLRILLNLRGVMAFGAGQGKGQMIVVAPVFLFQSLVMAHGAVFFGHGLAVALE